MTLHFNWVLVIVAALIVVGICILIGWITASAILGWVLLGVGLGLLVLGLTGKIRL